MAVAVKKLFVDSYIQKRFNYIPTCVVIKLIMSIILVSLDMSHCRSRVAIYLENHIINV